MTWETVGQIVVLMIAAYFIVVSAFRNMLSSWMESWHRRQDRLWSPRTHDLKEHDHE